MSRSPGVPAHLPQVPGACSYCGRELLDSRQAAIVKRGDRFRLACADQERCRKRLKEAERTSG